MEEQTIPCPMCSEVNAAERETCHNCGARLKPFVVSESKSEKRPPEAVETEPAIPPAEAMPTATEEVLESEPAPPPEGTILGEQQPGVEQESALPPQEIIQPEEEFPLPQELMETWAEEIEPQEAMAEELALGWGAEKKKEEAPEAGVKESLVLPSTPSLLATIGREQASIFQRVVTRPFPSPTPAKPKEKFPLERWLIYSLLVVALLTPLLARDLVSFGLPLTPGTRSFYDVLQLLPPGSKVLLAVDFSPTTAAEISPQAQAILNHLAERQAQVVAVSLDPQGPALAQNVLDEILGSRAGYRYGVQYLNLGFVSGGEAGLRSLAQGTLFLLAKDFREGKVFSQFSLAQNIESIGDFDLVVVLAGNPDALRLWVEQIQTPFQVDMVAAVTAQADPQARPYYQSGQIQGFLSGLPGAAEYEKIRGQQGPALQAIDSQNLGQLALAVFILLGNMAFVISQARRGSQ